MKELFGCGYDPQLAGKASIQRAGRFKERFPESKTCPEFYARSLFVYSVYQYLKAYRNGGLGNVLDLDNVLLDYLQILDRELDELESWVTEQLYAD